MVNLLKQVEINNVHDILTRFSAFFISEHEFIRVWSSNEFDADTANLLKQVEINNVHDILTRFSAFFISEHEFIRVWSSNELHRMNSMLIWQTC